MDIMIAIITAFSRISVFAVPVFLEFRVRLSDRLNIFVQSSSPLC